VVAQGVGDFVEEGQAEFVVGEFDAGVVGFCPGDCEALALKGGLGMVLVVGCLGGEVIGGVVRWLTLMFMVM
jgi:hypothetical protein